jgi:hypothetical protein
VDDSSADSQAIPLAAIRYGMPVLDVRGAFLGRIEYVGTTDPGVVGEPHHGVLGNQPASGAPRTPSDADDTRRTGFVRLATCGPRDDLLVASAHIACVADDHIRLSITADEALTAGTTLASP